MFARDNPNFGVRSLEFGVQKNNKLNIGLCFIFVDTSFSELIESHSLLADLS